MESKQQKTKLVDTENRLGVIRGRGGEWVKWVMGVKDINFQLETKSWEYNLHHGDDSSRRCIIYLKESRS